MAKPKNKMSCVWRVGWDFTWEQHIPGAHPELLQSADTVARAIKAKKKESVAFMLLVSENEANIQIKCPLPYLTNVDQNFEAKVKVDIVECCERKRRN